MTRALVHWALILALGWTIQKANLSAQSIRQGPRTLPLEMQRAGRWVPDLSFVSIDGERGKLSDYEKKNALVIAFVGASCPLSKKFAPTLAALEREWAKKDVSFIFVDPISTESTNLKLREMVGRLGFQGPVVQDKTKALAKGLAATTTTEVFLLDSARTILYHGPVDDQYGIGYQIEAPRNQYLQTALRDHLQGRKIRITSLWAPGCELDLSSPEETTIEWTYHNRISRIMQSHCVECHRAGGVGPFPLETYDDVRENAGMISKVIRDGLMPPWFAAPPPSGHPSPWANDRSMPQADKDDLLGWIRNGKALGNPADSPMVTKRSGDWSIGRPDALFSLPKEVSVKATGQMPYAYFKVPTGFNEDRWVEAAEVQPTALEAVHHVIVFVTDSQGRKREPLVAYVPGNSFYQYPPGVAKKIPSGSDLLFQMHYTPMGKPTKDRTRIGLRFAQVRPSKAVRTFPILNKRINIPPRTDNHIETASETLPEGVAVRALMPHMHLRGKAIRYELFSGSKEVVTLLDVPHYDFNWQMRYELIEPMVMPKENRILVTGIFDNSKGNLANPNPDERVHWGDQSDDEMLIGYVEYETDVLANEESVRSPSADLFSKLDQDGNGFLSKSEFPKPRLFSFFDQNQDGRVSREEGTTGVESLKKRSDGAQGIRAVLRGLTESFR